MNSVIFCLCTFLFLAGVVVNASGQKEVTPPTGIKFTEAWAWEYRNEEGGMSEMVLYLEPKRNYWLFTQEAYGTSGEMIEWILGKPDGTYIGKATDEFGKVNYFKEVVEFEKVTALSEHFIPTGKTQVFGDTSYGFPKLKGDEYDVKFEWTNDRAKVVIGDTKVNMLAVYFFNQLNGDAKLPIDFYRGIPPKKIILKDELVTPHSQSLVRFKFISHAIWEI